MRIRSCGQSLLALLLIAGVIAGMAYYDSIANTLAGCTDSVVGRFEKLLISQEYEISYIQQLESEGHDIWGFNWQIKRQDEGCIIEATAGGPGAGARSGWTNFTGDSFFVNLNEGRVYPQSAGAQKVVGQASVKLP